MPFVFLVPKNVPAVDGLRDFRLVVDYADGSPTIRHGVFVAGIKRLCLIEKFFADIFFGVGQFVEVERLQKIVANHFLNHVIGRADNVVMNGTFRHARIHALVGVEFVKHDVNAGLLLKSLEHFGIEIVAPTVDVNLFLFATVTA